MELAIWDKADGSRVMFISQESQNIRREGRGRTHFHRRLFWKRHWVSLLPPRWGLKELPVLLLRQYWDGTLPRSFVVKFASYRTKEDILKKAWQARVLYFPSPRIHLDNDYAPEIQWRRREYVATKKVLWDNNIRFQSPFPPRLRVYYSDGAVMYNTAHEETTNIMKRGLSVDVKDRATLLDQIRQQTWQTSAKKKQWNMIQKQGFKERLQAFRHQCYCG